MVTVSARIRVPHDALIKTIVDVRSAPARTEYITLSAGRGEMILRAADFTGRRLSGFRSCAPCEGRLPQRLAFDTGHYGGLRGASFYEREIDLIYSADAECLYVGKYWVPLRLIPPCSATTAMSAEEEQMAARIAILDAMNQAAPPRSVAELAQRYERDDELVRLIKRLRGDTCQLCGAAFAKRDGTLYSECHHLEALANGGLDVSRNMIVLCPNHHAQFHHGAVEVVDHCADLLRVKIDGHLHTCDLTSRAEKSRDAERPGNG